MGIFKEINLNYTFEIDKNDFKLKFLKGSERKTFFAKVFLSLYFISFLYSLDFLSNKEFVTTETDENAIAAPAIIGLSRPNAASGMPTVL